VSAGTDLHERTLSIETRPLEGERLGVRGELLDVRRIEMPGYLGGFHPAGLSTTWRSTSSSIAR
jgi:hypothetical protein